MVKKLTKKQIDFLLSLNGELKSLDNNQINILHKKILREKNNRMDLKKEINSWLFHKSEKTKITYKKGIKLFLKFIDNKNISILFIDSIIIDDFINDLTSNKKLKSNSIRIRIAACSSFLKHLVRHGFLSTNYFIGAHLPRRERAVKRTEQVPTNWQLKKIEKCFIESVNDRRGKGANKRYAAAKRMYAAFLIIVNTGIRVGALNTFRIDSGWYTAKSKGKNILGKIENSIIEKIKSLELNPDYPFKECGAFHESFRTRFCKITEALGFKQITPHSLRHYFAVKHYKKNKDVALLMRAMGHSSLDVTTDYLSTLPILINNK
jgi:integrase